MTTTTIRVAAEQRSRTSNEIARPEPAPGFWEGGNQRCPRAECSGSERLYRGWIVLGGGRKPSGQLAADALGAPKAFSMAIAADERDQGSRARRGVRGDLGWSANFHRRGEKTSRCAQVGWFGFLC